MDEYVRQMEERGELLHVRRQVDPKHELASVTYKSQTQSDRPIMFHDVKGTDFPVVTNLFGSRRRLAEKIGADDGRICHRWNEILNSPLPEYPSTIEVEEPADLRECRMQDLPQITYCEHDVGPYITAGVYLANDPDTGTPNLSFHRTMLVSDTEGRVRLGPPHDMTNYQKRAEARDEALQVAVLVGPPPEIFLGGCASIPRDQSELDISAKLRGNSIPMRRCKTVDLMVPAETAIVIEGRILPHERRPEGPFGEFLWHYAAEGLNHVLDISRVTHREGAAFHSLVCGSPEDLVALDIAFASRVYNSISKDIPGIVDVICQPILNTTIVKIKKSYPDQARHVMLKTFASHLQYNKVCIVVDEDIDISDFDQVWWAVMTRTQLNHGIMHLTDIPGFYSDHGIPGLHAGRLGIDATTPEGGTSFERKRLVGFDDLNLADYLS